MIINSILKQLKLLVKGNSAQLFIVMSLFSVILYAPSLRGGFIADDYGQILANRYIKDLRNLFLYFGGGTFDLGYGTSLAGMYYRPVMIIAYALLYALFGTEAFYYHLFQLFIHTVNGFIVFLIFDKLLKSAKLSIFLSFVFLGHTMNSETVTYIANLQDTLMFMFGGVGLLLLLKRNWSGWYLPILFILFALSLFSKETAIIYLIIYYLVLNLLKKRPVIGQTVLYGGFAVVVALYVFIRCGVAGICLISSNAPIAKLSFTDRLLHMPHVFIYYFKTFFYPAKLAILQQWVIEDFTVTGVILSFFAAAIILISIISVPFIVYAWRRKLNRHVLDLWYGGDYPLGRVYSFFLLWLLAGISMHLQMIPLDFTVADRWFYMPMVGLLGIIGCVLSLFRPRSIYVLSGLLIIFSLGWSTYNRSLDWFDPLKLYKHDIAVSPDSGPLQNNYAAELLNRGKTTEAKKHFLYAVKLQPENPIYWSNLGIVAEREGEKEKALEYYGQSIKVGKWQYAFERYFILLKELGKNNEANVFLRDKAIKHFPENKIFTDEVSNL